MADKELDPDTLQSLLDEEGPDEAQEQSDFEASFSGEEPEKHAEEQPEEHAHEEQPEEDSAAHGEEEKAESEENPENKLLSEIQSLGKRLRNIEGKYGTLNSQIQQAAKQSAKEQDAPIPTRQQVSEALKDNEKWKSFKEDFPEYSEAMEEGLAAHEERILQKIPNPDAMTGQIMSTVSSMIIRTRHSDWVETINTPEFIAWANDENNGFQDSDDPFEIIEQLDRFKESMTSDQEEDQEKEQQKKRSRLESAVQPTRGSTKRPVQKSAEAAFEEAFNQA